MVENTSPLQRIASYQPQVEKQNFEVPFFFLSPQIGKKKRKKEWLKKWNFFLSLR